MLASAMPERRPEVLDFMATRRSVAAKTLIGPGPAKDELAALLTLGVRVPDHGKLTPWRFIVIEANRQHEVGELAASQLRLAGHDESTIEKTRRVFNNGAVIVTVVFSPDLTSKIPSWEQELSAGAVCLNLVNAGLASGWGANWLTGPLARDRAFLKQTLNCNSNEWVAGFIHLGQPTVAPTERDRPDVDALTIWY